MLSQLNGVQRKQATDVLGAQEKGKKARSRASSAAEGSVAIMDVDVVSKSSNNDTAIADDDAEVVALGNPLLVPGLGSDVGQFIKSGV